MGARRPTGARQAIGTLALLGTMLLAGVPSAGAAAPPVTAKTGGVSHLHGTSAELTGKVTATNVPSVSVFFEYGPTVAYGSKTKATTIVPPTVTGKESPKPVKIGQQVTGLLPNYHFRIVATWVLNGVAEKATGADKSFSGGKATQLKIVLPHGREERLSAVYGGTLELTGSLTGTGKENHGLQLQATPFPYTAPFTTLTGTVLSSRTGTFLFRVAHLTGSTQMRVLTVDTRPVYSKVVTVHVTPRITLHVRSAGHSGLYRLYGTVAAARAGAQLSIQQLTPQKAGSKREGPAAHSVGSTVLKKATKSLSRFSVILKLSGTFHYRAFVKLPKGAIESGHSANVLIKAPKGSTKHKH